MYFCTICPSIGPKERSRQTLDRLPLVSNSLTNFWMQVFDGARLSPNSVRNAVWHSINEPVCQYVRKRNPRYSTVYIDNSLGPLARDSPCVILIAFTLQIFLRDRAQFLRLYSTYTDCPVQTQCDVALRRRCAPSKHERSTES